MRRGEGPRVVLRFLISFKTAGVIIGKGGENINKIRDEFHVKIIISDSCGPERVLTLEGDMGSVMEILNSVLSRQIANNREDGVDLRLLVHQSQAGCVIGRAGYKIKELREQSSLRTLKVYQMLCPSSTDRVIQLVGDVEKVLNCLQSIADLLEGAPPKGSRKNYDSLDADENLAAEYGGWGTPGQTIGGLNNVNRRNMSGAYGQAFNSTDQTNLLNNHLFGSSRNGTTTNGNGISATGLNHHHQNASSGNDLTGNISQQQLGGQNTTGASHHHHSQSSVAALSAAVNQVLAHHAHQLSGQAGGMSGSGGQSGNNLNQHLNLQQQHHNNQHQSLSNHHQGLGGIRSSNQTNNNGGGSQGMSGNAGGGATGSLPHASAAAMLAATGGQSAGGNSITTGPAGDAANQVAAMAAANMMRGNVPARLNIVGPQATAQVSVQNKMIGAIMGRGGCRISQVRQESGADIKISKQESSIEDRIITITGTPEQIHNAQFLMQVCVKRYGDSTGV